MGLTVLLSSHLLYEVEQICNRVAIIDRGRLLYQGTLEGLVSREKTVKLTVDRPDEAFALLAADSSLVISRNGEQSLYITMTDEQIPALNRLLVERGFQVSELSPSRETLEHVFLRLTAKAGSARLPRYPISRNKDVADSSRI
jgi:ABC-2 type transport system ATP-binding protein